MEAVKVGFTGTRHGLSQSQIQKITAWLVNGSEKIKEFHHGDCVGADSTFHDICVTYYPSADIIIHPPSDNKLRAYKKGKAVLNPLPYLKRNHNLVDACDILIACPQSAKEELRSGTWATIRYARKCQKLVVIVAP